MKAIKGMQQYLAQGRQAEKSGNLAEAAASYEKVAASDPTNDDAVTRLLILYRKLKDHKKELAVIDRAIAGYKSKNKAIQENWLRAHPGAAGAGKAVLRSLGGATASAFGTDPVVNRLLKRREGVGRKIDGKSAGSGRKRKAGRSAAGKTESRRIKQMKAKQETAERRKEQIRVKREAAEQRKADLAAKLEEARQRKQQAQDEKEETKRRKQQVKREREAVQTILGNAVFVITLRYLVPLEEIDAAMREHVAFLDKYYKSGNILLSGRQIPRTGGVIIAKANNRHAAERMMKQDPFVKRKLASFDILQFSPRKAAEGLTHNK